MDAKRVSAQLEAMKAIYFHLAGAVALTFGLAACMSAPQFTPPPAEPVAAATPTPSPAPPPPPRIQEPVYDNYLDAPQSAGTWEYVSEPAETLAVFGLDRARPDFIIRCDRRTRTIGLARRSETPGSKIMRIKTETTERQLTASAVPGRALVAAELSPTDDVLDAMAITKGRVLIGTENERTLYIPAWVEITRVIEDCR